MSDPRPRFIQLGAKRRCPHCSSSKWDRLDPDGDGRERQHTEYGQLTRFSCRNCQNEFLVEERPLTKFMTRLGRCGHCGSPRLKLHDDQSADCEIFVCRQCQNYTVLLLHQKDSLT